MEEDTIYIYIIRNTINDIIYIGQTTDVHRRLLEHIKLARNIKKTGKTVLNAMYEDINLYGGEKFYTEVIDTCHARHKYVIEKYWTEKYKHTHKIYNINSGSSMSEKQKEMLRQVDRASNAIFKTEEFVSKMSTVTSGENNGMYGKKGTDAINGRHVFMCDENFNVVQEFVSVRTALEHLGLVGHVELMKACKNKTMYRGYYWTKDWKNC